ncbi:DUF4181 domain-containing protein [Lysinibacillus sphaericus]
MFIDYLMLILTMVTIVIIAIGFFIDRWIRKKLNIPRKAGVLYKPVHPIQGWIEAFIVIAGIILIFNVDFENVNQVVMIPLIFLLQNVFRAIMEWKFDRESREYIITAFSIGVLLVVWPALVAYTYFI